MKTADVFIQNFRPGVAERLGVGAGAAAGDQPAAGLLPTFPASATTARGSDRPAFDTVSQARSGFLRLLVNPANPRVVGPAIGDAVTGFFAA